MDQFGQWIANNTLITLSIVIPKKGQKKLWGRILSYDEKDQSFMFYNDDEKNAQRILFSQIDELTVNNIEKQERQEKPRKSDNLQTESPEAPDVSLDEVIQLLRKLSPDELLTVKRLLQHITK